MSDTLDQLVSEFLQYGDRPFIGPDACDRLRTVIVQLTSGAVNPPFDRMGENHTYWMAKTLQYMRNNPVSGVLWTSADPLTGEKLGVSTAINDIPGLKSLTFLTATSIGGFNLQATTELESISFPNLSSITGQFTGVTIAANLALTSVSFPALRTVADIFDMDSNPLLASISAPMLTSIGGNLEFDSIGLRIIDMPSLTFVGSGGIYCDDSTDLVAFSFPRLTTVVASISAQNCSSLSEINLPEYLPTNGSSLAFFGAALTASSVNGVLARCVSNPSYASGIVDLSGGTSAAPSGQGIIDKATLIGRGVSVNTN